MREIIEAELVRLADELEEADTASDIATLEGWQHALKWVIRRLPEEG